MNQNEQINECCVIHKNEKLMASLCIAEDCDKISRFFCQECVYENLHSHQSMKPQFLKKQQFLEQFDQNLQNLKSKKILLQQEIFGSTIELVEQLNNSFQHFKDSYEFINNQISSKEDETYFQELRHKINHQFYQLSSVDINSILKISQYKLNCSKEEQLSEICNALIEKCEQFITNLQYKLKLLKEVRPTKNFAKIQDEIKFLKYTEKESILKKSILKEGDFINSMAISPNNQHMAIFIGNYEKKYDKQGNHVCNKYTSYSKLINLMSNKTYDILRLSEQHSPYFFQFTNDSKILYYQSYKQHLKALQLKDEKCQEYGHFIEPNSIQFILPISEIIAFIINNKSKIIKLDMINKLELCQQQSNVKLRELIYDNVNNILISAGDVLECWSCDLDKVQLIYEDNLNLAFNKLQFLRCNSKIITFNTKTLYIIQVVNAQKMVELKNLQQYKFEQDIVSYSLVYQEQFIVVFGSQGVVKIIDFNFQVIKTIYTRLSNIRYAGCSNDCSSMTIGSYDDYLRRKILNIIINKYPQSVVSNRDQFSEF
ncbi:hypothetical protein pb186bvf_020738 [Paramecium bursaria]